LTKEEKIAQESALDMDSFLEDLYRYEIVYTQGDVENGAVPAGQTCGLIDSVMDVGDIITSFSKQAEEILKNLSAKIP
jgi:NAD(P)H-dependent flavin oxidoreductase YrpB (nitropropane dioxygenase family)